MMRTSWQQCRKDRNSGTVCRAVFGDRLCRMQWTGREEQEHLHLFDLLWLGLGHDFKIWLSNFLRVSRSFSSWQSHSYTLNAYAKDLLKGFVLNSSIFYGNAFVTFNIHNLIHVSGDVMRSGPIYSFLAYRFENFLVIIKRLLRKIERTLQQCNRSLNEFMKYNWAIVLWVPLRKLAMYWNFRTKGVFCCHIWIEELLSTVYYNCQNLISL
jgi:hypothetical protein